MPAVRAPPGGGWVMPADGGSPLAEWQNCCCSYLVHQRYFAIAHANGHLSGSRKPMDAPSSSCICWLHHIILLLLLSTSYCFCCCCCSCPCCFCCCKCCLIRVAAAIGLPHVVTAVAWRVSGQAVPFQALQSRCAFDVTMCFAAACSEGIRFCFFPPPKTICECLWCVGHDESRASQAAKSISEQIETMLADTSAG